MEKKTNLKIIVANNFDTVNETIRFIENFISSFEETISSIKNPTEEVLLVVGMNLMGIGKLMDGCERVLDKTLLSFSSATTEDFDTIDVNALIEEYITVSNNYRNLKKKAESTIMDETYLKTIFNKNT